jgi:peptidoglycan/LPS O-acetylase OafA/YrhL
VTEFRRIEAADSRLFDFFRGLSAWVVVLAHFHQIVVHPSYPDARVSKLMGVVAAAAVAVFFVISGFMVGSSMLRNLAENPGGFDLGRFARDRLIRLYPPLLFALLVTGLVAVIGVGPRLEFPGPNQARESFAENPRAILGSVFFLQGLWRELPVPNLNGPLWSLSYEFWFYVLGLAYPAWRIFRSDDRPGATPSSVSRGLNRGCAPVVGCVIPFLVLLLTSPYARYFFAGFLVWASGAFLALAYQRRKLSLPLGITVAILGTLAWIATATSSRDALLTASRFLGGVAFTGILLTLLATQPKLKLPNFIVESSRYSYTLYAVHFPILLLIQGFTGRQSFKSPLLLLATGAVSLTLLYFLSSRTARVLENREQLLKLLEKIRVR